MDMSVRFPNLQIYFGYVGRSISVFGFELTIYGLLIAAGMFLGLMFVLHQAKHQNENQNLYLEMLIPAVLGGVIGSRLFYILFHWQLFTGQSIGQICDIRKGGVSLYGGILGGVIFSALFCRFRKISFQRMADTASMGLLIAQIIGVWGNFFNRESFGEYTDSLFAMQIPLDVVHSSQVSETMKTHLMTVDDVSYIQVHPLFFYESVWCLLLFLILLVYTRKKTYQGEIFLRYLAGYSLGRMGLEWLRGNPLKIPGMDIPVFLPVFGVLFVVCGLSATVRRILSKKREARRRHRREERYAEEQKAARNYDEIQAYENVSDEFWNTENSDFDSKNFQNNKGISDSYEKKSKNPTNDLPDTEDKVVEAAEKQESESSDQKNTSKVGQDGEKPQGSEKMSEDQSSA